MLEITRSLAERLRKLEVRVDVPDADTLLLRRVPINAQFFNKPHTTLVATRPCPGMPFLVCVDEDLRYQGGDAQLARIFAGSINQQGHRVLLLTIDAADDLQSVLDRALALLGFDGQSPRASAPDVPPRGSAATSSAAPVTALLDGLGHNLTRRGGGAGGDACLGRDAEIDAVLAALRTWGQTRLPVILGPSGCGKSALLRGVAAQLADRTPPIELLSIDLAVLLSGTMFPSQRESLLSSLLEEISRQSNRIVALEHLELGLFGTTPLLLCHALDQGYRLLGTLLPEHAPLLAAEPLARRVRVVRLEPLDAAATFDALAAARQELAAHHGLEIGVQCVQTCVRLAQSLPGEFPAKALELLDTAAAGAAVRGAEVLGPDDLYDARTHLLALAGDGD